MACTCRGVVITAFCFGLAIASARVDMAMAQTTPAASDVRVTVIGCIRRSQPAAATIDTTVIPDGGTKYELVNITLAAEPRGTDARSTLLAQAVKMYRLDNSANALIAPHVGDRVEVTGTVLASPPSPAGTAGTTKPMPADASPVPRLRVESLHKISSSSTVCAQD